jgi:hypothetical protein
MELQSACELVEEDLAQLEPALLTLENFRVASMPNDGQHEVFFKHAYHKYSSRA